MRKWSLVLALSLLAAACNDPVATNPEPEFDEAALLGFSGSLTSDPGSHYLGHLHRLPDALALTAAQQESIRTLLAAFQQATEADREALAAIGRQAREAAQAGKTREEITTILAQGAPARERLRAAEAKLRSDIDAVLTAEQKAWLAAQDGRRCTPVPLTDQQRTQISALVAAFQEANKADFATVQSALAAAREAHRSGATREQIAAILEGVRPAMERIRAASEKLAADVEALLTPEQKASGCFRIGGLPGAGGGGRPHR
jgi:Spy/CpxP family protein refolding chaperone